jgi:hypothetical protein
MGEMGKRKKVPTCSKQYNPESHNHLAGKGRKRRSFV